MRKSLHTSSYSLKDRSIESIGDNSNAQENLVRDMKRLRLMKKSVSDLVDIIYEKEQIISEMRFKYFKELNHYRQATDMKVAARIKRSDTQLLVQYFDETHGIDPGLIEIFNNQLKNIEKQYRAVMDRHADEFDLMVLKLEKFESLPIDRQFLVNMNFKDFLECMAVLEKDSFVVWNSIEETYYPGFFEDVVFKKFGYMFDENSEKNLLAHAERIRLESAHTIVSFKTMYDQAQTYNTLNMDPLVSSLILKQLQQNSLDNQYCFDCYKKHVTHVSEAFAIFICDECAQIHQGLDEKITRILSITEHKWTQQQLKKLTKGGNKRLEDYYLGYDFDRSTIHSLKKKKKLVNTVLRYQVQASLYYKEYLEKYSQSGIDGRASWTPNDDELFQQNTPAKEAGRELVNDINDFVIKLEQPNQEAENNLIEEQQPKSYLGSMWSTLSYAASSISTSSANFADRTEERLKKMDEYLYGVEDYVVQSVKESSIKTKDSIVNNTSDLYNNGREASMIVSTKEKTYEVTNKVSQMVSQAKSKMTDRVKESMTTETSSADLSGDGFEEVKDEFDSCE